MSMFNGLGNTTPAGQPVVRQYLDALGDYGLEVLKLTAKKSERPSTLGQSIFAAEFVVREAADLPDDAMPKKHRALYPAERPDEGAVVSLVLNLTKNPYAAKDVRAIVDALIPVMSDVFGADDLAALDALEKSGGDVYEAVAVKATEGDGQLFAGTRLKCRVLGTGKEDSGVTQYTRKFFSVA